MLLDNLVVMVWRVKRGTSVAARGPGAAAILSLPQARHVQRVCHLVEGSSCELLQSWVCFWWFNSLLLQQGA